MPVHFAYSGNAVVFTTVRDEYVKYQGENMTEFRPGPGPKSSLCKYTLHGQTYVGT